MEIKEATGFHRGSGAGMSFICETLEGKWRRPLAVVGMVEDDEATWRKRICDCMKVRDRGAVLWEIEKAILGVIKNLIRNEMIA